MACRIPDVAFPSEGPIMSPVAGSHRPAFDKVGRSLGVGVHGPCLARQVSGLQSSGYRRRSSTAGEKNERCLLVSRHLWPDVSLSSKKAWLLQF